MLDTGIRSGRDAYNPKDKRLENVAAYDPHTKKPAATQAFGHRQVFFRTLTLGFVVEEMLSRQQGKRPENAAYGSI